MIISRLDRSSVPLDRHQSRARTETTDSSGKSSRTISHGMHRSIPFQFNLGAAEATRAKKLQRPQTTDIPVRIRRPTYPFEQFLRGFSSDRSSFESVFKHHRITFDSSILLNNLKVK